MVLVHTKKQLRGVVGDVCRVLSRAEPCNLRGTCQTNNTCFCTNGYATCRPQDGTMTSATAGCETNIYTSKSNCGTCGNVRLLSC